MPTVTNTLYTVTDNINIERKTVKWITDQMKDELLFVDNSFQRQYVWIHKNQVRLIETILLGYVIPEIYLWERETDSKSGNTKLSIIDGQQRLGSVFDFINDKFALKSSYLDFKGNSYANKTFSELSETERNFIWKYPISVRFIREIVKREDIVSMFLRLNSTSTSLNPQELRNAEFNGLFLQLAGELAQLDIWNKYPLFTGYDYRRMKDIEFISSLLIFIRLGIEEETTQTSINKVYDTFNDDYPEYEEDKELFILLIQLIEGFFEDNDSVKRFLSKKVHFYTLFNIAYFSLRTTGILTNEHKANYLAFIDNYENLEARKENLPATYYALILEYYSLSQEGTQRKSNRIRRFEIVKNILLG